MVVRREESEPQTVGANQYPKEAMGGVHGPLHEPRIANAPWSKMTKTSATSHTSYRMLMMATYRLTT